MNEETIKAAIIELKSAVRSQYAIAVAALIVSGLIGMIVPAAKNTPSCTQSAMYVSQYNWPCTIQNMPEWFVRLGVIFLLCVVGNYVARSWMSYKNDAQLVEQMNTDDGNDTPAFVNAGYLLAIVVLVWRVPFVGLTMSGIMEFLVNIVHRWSMFGLFAPLALAAVLFWRCKARSFRDVVILMHTPNTNALGIWTLVGLVSAAFITIAF